MFCVYRHTAPDGRVYNGRCTRRKDKTGVPAFHSENGTDVNNKAGAYASALLFIACRVSVYASKIGMNSIPT